MITRGAFKALLQAQGKPPKALPRQQHPDLIATAYTKKIQAMMAWLQERVKVELYPLLKSLTDEASRIATTDASEVKFVVVIRKPDGSRTADLVSATEANAAKAAGRVEAQSQGRWQAEVLPADRVLADPTIEVNTAIKRKLEGTSAPESDAVAAQIDKLRAEFDAKFSREKISGVVHPFAEATEKFQAEQLNRQLREAVAVDVVGSETWLAKAADEFTRENVALIRTIPSRYFDEIETLVRREAADGARWETLVTGIEERYDVSRSRSKIIARDQVGKFYGDLNRVRQTDLGITRFVWRTVRDNRVRPEHADIDGHSFTWGSAPDGGPGEAVLCRCYAEPDLSSVSAEPV